MEGRYGGGNGTMHFFERLKTKVFLLELCVSFIYLYHPWEILEIWYVIMHSSQIFWGIIPKIVDFQEMTRLSLQLGLKKTQLESAVAGGNQAQWRMVQCCYNPHFVDVWYDVNNLLEISCNGWFMGILAMDYVNHYILWIGSSPKFIIIPPARDAIH